MNKLCWINDESEQVKEQYRFLTQTCGYIDFESRGRLCLTGEDRKAFLHGQVTQDVKNLAAGTGTFSALADGKGKIQADLNIYCLTDELLLDFDAGLTDMVKQRLERYLVSEDVDIIDPSEFYTMISVQGPRAVEAMSKVFPDISLPAEPWNFVEVSDGDDGGIYVCHRPRCGAAGYDLFISKSIAPRKTSDLLSAVEALGGGVVEDPALRLATMEAGVPLMGRDMSDEILVQETGLELQTVSYQKGCYIGQEVISRIRTVGKVNKALRLLEFQGSPQLENGMELCLFSGDQVAGTVTSAALIPDDPCRIRGFGYVKRAFLDSDAPLTCKDLSGSEIKVRIIGLPSALGHLE